MVLFRLISAFLEPEDFLTAVMESALCLVPADDGEGENIFKADSKDGVKKKGYSVTVYLPPHLNGFRDLGYWF